MVVIDVHYRPNIKDTSHRGITKHTDDSIVKFVTGWPHGHNVQFIHRCTNYNNGQRILPGLKPESESMGHWDHMPDRDWIGEQVASLLLFSSVSWKQSLEFLHSSSPNFVAVSSFNSREQNSLRLFFVLLFVIVHLINTGADGDT